LPVVICVTHFRIRVSVIRRRFLWRGLGFSVDTVTRSNNDLLLKTVDWGSQYRSGSLAGWGIWRWRQIVCVVDFGSDSLLLI
jgi:hypothetical protein